MESSILIGKSKSQVINIQKKISPELTPSALYESAVANGAQKSLILLEALSNNVHPIVAITKTDDEARVLAREFCLLSGVEMGHMAHFIPSNDTLPFDRESPSEVDISRRNRAMYDLSMFRRSSRLITISAGALLQRVVPRVFWGSRAMPLFPGKPVSQSQIAEKLASLGYRKSASVIELGQYCGHPEIMDIYPYGSKSAYRIAFSGGTVKSISEINPITQRSGSTVNAIELLPVREFSIDQSSIRIGLSRWRTRFGSVVDQPEDFRMSGSAIFPGMEYYLPLIEPNLVTMFDYFPEESEICFIDDARDALFGRLDMIADRHSDLSLDKSRHCLNPSDLWITREDVYAEMGSHSGFYLADADKKPLFVEGIRTLGEKNQVSRGESVDSILDAIHHCATSVDVAVFFIGTVSRINQVELLVNACGLNCEVFDNWASAVKSGSPVKIIKGSISEGFVSTDLKLAFISEEEVFGSAILQKERVESQKAFSVMDFSSLSLVRKGDPVVHVQHGIGRFNGLVTTEFGADSKKECLSISFDESVSIEVPVSEINSVLRYSGIDRDEVPVSNLRSKKWEKICNEASLSAFELADTLIKRKKIAKKQSAKRIDSPGHEYELFRSEFLFTETPDQIRAEKDIQEDLESHNVMNRIVCGDVGFGKTEVAMRAAFMAVNSGFQVAVLAPTTLLVKQHYENFKERFSRFDIEIHLLSKTVGKTTEKEIKELAKSGKGGIFIGTHKLLQSDVMLANVGLLVIDEEHRFGTAQKKLIQEQSVAVNTLYMSATPIPRTLGMALIGLKATSTLETPPAKRLSIRTYSEKFNLAVVKESIEREMLRGGQVFYLNNRIEFLESRADMIRDHIPCARIAVIHGKMNASEMEQVMGDFSNRLYDVLVCTTVIETGIDIPNANTMIVEQAENFGISQLHQIRGRVGRSTRQAYCYLMTGDFISKNQAARLDAMIRHSKLGEGAALAYHDLEVRGAGEALGEEQSGNIQKVGYQLYVRFIKEALRSLDVSAKKEMPAVESNILIGVDYLIPEAHIPSEQTRMDIYSQIQSCEVDECINETERMVKDRFGTLPGKVSLLFDLLRLKIRCRTAGVVFAFYEEGELILRFYSKELFMMSGAPILVATSPERFTAKNENELHCSIDSSLGDSERIAEIGSILGEIL